MIGPYTKKLLAPLFKQLKNNERNLNMLASEKIKRTILFNFLKNNNDIEEEDFDKKLLEIDVTNPEVNISELWDELEGKYYLQDDISEFREGQFTTQLPSQSSRHYEAIEVASKMFDNSYVGWTFWYGGGKYGCPDEVEWMDEAYELTLKEEEKVVTVRTWSKI